MLTRFYHRHARRLLLAAVVAFPWLAMQSESMPANNDLDTWLPHDSQVLSTYREFTQQFGAEELILVGLVDRDPKDPLIEAIAARLERLPGIRQCWTPERLADVMSRLGVTPAEIDERIAGFARSRDGRLTGLIALLSAEGVYDRAATVDSVRTELSYCQLGDDEMLLSGAPVVIAELDRLGSVGANKLFFLSTFLLSALVLYLLFQDLRISGGIVGITLWAVVATNTAVKHLGGQMNFILSALPVMVLIFTLSVAIHFLHYYRDCHGESDPVGAAMRRALPPCFWATLTTVIGLLSLMVSEITPVEQFGWAASLGAVIAALAALTLTPALLVLCPLTSDSRNSLPGWAPRLGSGIVAHRRKAALAAVTLVAAGSLGLPNLRTHIDPVEFLPSGSRIVHDLLKIEEQLTPTESIEAVVDFGIEDRPFVEKLHEVRRIEDRIAAQPGVRHTVSLATFFPRQMPESPLEMMRMLGHANSKSGQNDFVSAGERFWRVSARVSGTPQQKFEIYKSLQRVCSGDPVTFTGIAPLLVQAQRNIFEGFWESFAMAFGIITAVMIVSLRSFTLALLAMIPNVTPICLVFGLMGLFNVPVDIGMMMTASIALGIAVDGTFHFMLAYEKSHRRHGGAPRAARHALYRTGAPILQSAGIASLGMLALTLSQFTPTSRFGLLMATLLVAALIGDLILLPAMLALGRSRVRLFAAAPRRVAAASPLAPRRQMDFPEANAA